LALRGVDLLQKKRDALVQEFFSLVHAAIDARKQLNDAAKQAHMALLLAGSFDGPKAVEGLSLAVPVVSDVQAEVENVWGTRVPRFSVSLPQGSGTSPLAVGGQTLAAQKAFRNLFQALVQVANTESRLRRIGEEIKKTARRVNALELVVIPGLRVQIHTIQQALDQQEQEDVFRLKRIKRKLDASASKAEG
ncbi:MAG: V-type ATP synthase subunit D, partial [Desulfosarcinaceae bacterium]